MGPVRIHYRSHHFATSSSLFVDGAGWQQAKMAFPELRIHDIMRTAPIESWFFGRLEVFGSIFVQKVHEENLR